MMNSTITRREARMIAEELYAQMKADGLCAQMMTEERYLNAQEAADYLRMPLATLYQKAALIPHTKVGKRLIFAESKLRIYINNI